MLIRSTSRYYASPGNRVDSFWLCCSLLRLLHHRGDSEARALHLREVTVVLDLLGLGETDVRAALADLPDAEPLRHALRRARPLADDSSGSPLWALFEHTMTFALAWSDHLEGHPVLRGGARRARQSGEDDVLSLADDIVAHAEHGAALGERLSRLMVGRWGGDPERTVSVAEVMAVDPGLAHGCLWF